MTATEVVLGETGRNLRITLVDESGAPLNISGGSALLQGVSGDLPELKLNKAGTIVDGPNGVLQWPGIGDEAEYVSAAALGALPGATFSLRVKFTDAAAKVKFGELFQLRWVPAPDVS